MATSRLSLSITYAYGALLGVMLLMPKFGSEVYVPHNFIFALLHDLLYLSGPIEQIGNIFLFIPLFLAFVHLFQKTHLWYLAILCCGLSAAAELIQLQIPGRVSSLQDFISNSAGVLVTGLIFLSSPKLNKWVRSFK